MKAVKALKVAVVLALGLLPALWGADFRYCLCHTKKQGCGDLFTPSNVVVAGCVVAGPTCTEDDIYTDEYGCVCTHYHYLTSYGSIGFAWYSETPGLCATGQAVFSGYYEVYQGPCNNCPDICSPDYGLCGKWPLEASTGFYLVACSAEPTSYGYTGNVEAYFQDEEGTPYGCHGYDFTYIAKNGFWCDTNGFHADNGSNLAGCECALGIIFSNCPGSIGPD